MSDELLKVTMKKNQSIEWKAPNYQFSISTESILKQKKAAPDEQPYLNLKLKKVLTFI